MKFDQNLYVRVMAHYFVAFAVIIAFNKTTFRYTKKHLYPNPMKSWLVNDRILLIAYHAHVTG